MGQGGSLELVVAQNPYVGYGRNKREALENLTLCLQYYNQRPVQREQYRNLRDHPLMLLRERYFVYDGDRHIPVRVDKSNTGLYRAYVDL